MNRYRRLTRTWHPAVATAALVAAAAAAWWGYQALLTAGADTLLGILGRSLNGTAGIAGVSGGLSGPLRLRGLRADGMATGGVTFELQVRELVLEYHLPRILGGPRAFLETSRVRIERAEVTGEGEFRTGAGPPAQASGAGTFFPPPLSLEVEDLRIRWQGYGADWRGRLETLSAHHSLRIQGFRLATEYGVLTIHDANRETCCARLPQTSTSRSRIPTPGCVRWWGRRPPGRGLEDSTPGISTRSGNGAV